MNQWKESILKFCESENETIPIVEIISSNSKMNMLVYFAIINAINIPKWNRFLESFGTVIVDEVLGYGKKNI